MKETQPSGKVYVVTRNKRRIEDRNYLTASDAELRAEKLRHALKDWDKYDSKRINIVHTDKPNRIR